MREPITISFSGGSALLLQSNSTRFDEQFQKRVWSLANDLNTVDGFTETVPGMNNILVLFDHDRLPPEEARRQLAERWSKAQPLPRRGFMRRHCRKRLISVWRSMPLPPLSMPPGRHCSSGSGAATVRRPCRRMASTSCRMW